MGPVRRGLRRVLRGTSGDDKGEELGVGLEGGSDGLERCSRCFMRTSRVSWTSSSTQEGAVIEVSIPTNHYKGEDEVVGRRTGPEGPAPLGILFLDFRKALIIVACMMSFAKKK